MSVKLLITTTSHHFNRLAIHNRHAYAPYNFQLVMSLPFGT